MNIRRFPSLTGKQVSAVSALVCFLMVVSFVSVPWLFITPYDTPGDRHAITHESTDAYEDTVGQYGSTPDPIPIDELSPPARAVVEQGLWTYHRSIDWWSYEIAFCEEEMPVCDRERPDEFEYSTSGPDYNLIETEDGVYLLKTVDSAHAADVGFFGDSGPRLIIFPLVFAPIIGTLAIMTITSTSIYRYEPNPKIVLGLGLYGVLITVAGIVDPFLQMYYDTSIVVNHPLIWILATWVIISAAFLSIREARDLSRGE